MTKQVKLKRRIKKFKKLRIYLLTSFSKTFGTKKCFSFVSQCAFNLSVDFLLCSNIGGRGGGGGGGGRWPRGLGEGNDSDEGPSVVRSVKISFCGFFVGTGRLGFLGESEMK